ncbi:MAG: ABC transporter, ATP-binding protein [Ignavibacteriae bacterium]|nr:MAG: ABC transporter, ATP-binding protein [Ignavibacteriota bacterium]
MIQLINVTKKFNSILAVDNLSIEVPAGQFMGFLGPNGAGKTTTIKMMTGLYNPTSGKIIINGYDVVKQPIEAKLNIGYVPDQPYLYDKLTGREYLYFCGGLYKIPQEDLDIMVDEIIKIFEIEEWIDKRTESYSQGMAQRVVFAAALLHNPKIIIIDEPMVGLDPKSANIIKNILKEKCKNGSTVFMSTHILSVAEELCQRIVFIKKGRIVFDYAIEELIELKRIHNRKLEDLYLELVG